MAIRPNRFNDPALGEAFGNLASIFAPPSAQDTAAYTAARAKKEEAERLAWLFSNPTDPTASKRSALVGVQGYGATPEGFTYQVDQNNATQRYGYDTSAATSRDNNVRDNQRATIVGLYGPMSQGQSRPAIPADVMATQNLPGVAAVSGPAKPLSLDEVRAQERADLRERGVLTDTYLLDTIIGAEAPVKTVGTDGKPVYSTPGAAARTGAVAYVDQGSLPKPENGTAILPDGSQVPAIQDVATGKWKHAQTGADLPVEVRVVKMAAPTGSNEQLGLGKPAQNAIDRQLLDVAVAKDTAVKLRDLVASSPASQGAVGWLRGTAQNVIQTGGELGNYFGGGVKDVTDAIASGAADASLAGAFDPNIPAIEMMANLLAFQYAKTTTGERLSNEMLAQARRALGLEGLTANQASSLVRIDMAIKQMQSQEQILLDAKRRGLGALGQPAPAAPTAAPVAAPPLAGGTTRMRFDENGNPVQ